MIKYIFLKIKFISNIFNIIYEYNINFTPYDSFLSKESKEYLNCDIDLKIL